MGRHIELRLSVFSLHCILRWAQLTEGSASEGKSWKEDFGGHYECFTLLKLVTKVSFVVLFDIVGLVVAESWWLQIVCLRDSCAVLPRGMRVQIGTYLECSNKLRNLSHNTLSLALQQTDT